MFAYFYMAFLFGFSAGLVYFAMVVGGWRILFLGAFLIALAGWNFKLFGVKMVDLVVIVQRLRLWVQPTRTSRSTHTSRASVEDREIEEI